MGHINLRFGGKQTALRDTVMTEGCLGHREAKMYRNAGRWSTEYVEGVTTETVDLKLQLGDTQCMVFGPNDPPPFHACNTPVADVMGQKKNRKRKGGFVSGDKLELGVSIDGGRFSPEGPTDRGRICRQA